MHDNSVMCINVCIFFVVTGIARSIAPGQSLRCMNPISSQTKDAQVHKLTILI